ncbi:DUF3015 domain-containing protein [bacterium]|nr:DUF3015 domain-containing protein [bacterium]
MFSVCRLRIRRYKMKKISLFGLLFVLASSSAWAKDLNWTRPYGMAGCGLGSKIMGKNSGQIFAATTNGTFANQLFGITFGTLDCVDNPNTTVAARLDYFVSGNSIALASDIAKGGGETLASVSELMGCSASSNVGKVLKQNYKSIYPSQDVGPIQVTDSIIHAVQGDQQLKSECKNVI